MGEEANKSSNGDNKKRGPEATVWIAIISGLVTVIVALLSFPPLIEYFARNSTPTPSIPSSVPVTIPPIPADTDSAPATVAPTFPQAATAAPTVTLANDTPTSSLSVMHVSLVANKTTGKSPLVVKFDATASYVSAPDGTLFECKKEPVVTPGGFPLAEQK